MMEWKEKVNMNKGVKKDQVRERTRISFTCSMALFFPLIELFFYKTIFHDSVLHLLSSMMKLKFINIYWTLAYNQVVTVTWYVLLFHC